MDFNRAASAWDASPHRVERAREVSRAIRALLGDGKYPKALEFGCGTGLLSFFLSDRFQTVFLVDTAAGMLDEVKKKAAEAGLSGFFPRLVDLASERFEEGPVDVVYTLMSFHHVRDTDGMLSVFRSLLNPGGLLFIADLDYAGGRFHAGQSDFDGHDGFDRADLGGRVSKAGFDGIGFMTVFTTVKEVDGKPEGFPVFLMNARAGTCG